MTDYSNYVDQTANLIVIPSTNVNFTAMLPGMIQDAEGRIYRELDLLATRVVDSSAFTSSSSRVFTLPTTTGTYRVVEGLNIMSSDYRYPVVFTSREFIDVCYPSKSIATGIPEYAAMRNNIAVIFGPAPDAAYMVEVVGTQQPTALSSTNTSTILTTLIPDVFIAASMIYASAYMRNFGSQADNPQMSGSWEDHYNKLLQSANIEELRKKYNSQGWSNKIPSPIATPQRV